MRLMSQVSDEPNRLEGRPPLHSDSPQAGMPNHASAVVYLPSPDSYPPLLGGRAAVFPHPRYGAWPQMASHDTCQPWQSNCHAIRVRERKEKV